MNDKFKQLIFNRLYKKLSHIEIIPYNDSIWFIDREKTYWYFELTNAGKLWWRYDYFTNFFKIFGVDDGQFVPILIGWVEEVLNSKVSTSQFVCLLNESVVEEVLNSKVSTSRFQKYPTMGEVEEVLNHKVSATIWLQHPMIAVVEDVLNHKVLSTPSHDGTRCTTVEEVLNRKVSTTITDDSPDTVQVEKVLNNEQ